MLRAPASASPAARSASSSTRARKPEGNTRALYRPRLLEGCAGPRCPVIGHGIGSPACQLSLPRFSQDQGYSLCTTHVQIWRETGRYKQGRAGKLTGRTAGERRPEEAEGREEREGTARGVSPRRCCEHSRGARQSSLDLRRSAGQHDEAKRCQDSPTRTTRRSLRPRGPARPPIPQLPVPPELRLGTLDLRPAPLSPRLPPLGRLLALRSLVREPDLAARPAREDKEALVAAVADRGRDGGVEGWGGLERGEGTEKVPAWVGARRWRGQVLGGRGGRERSRPYFLVTGLLAPFRLSPSTRMASCERARRQEGGTERAEVAHGAGRTDRWAGQRRVSRRFRDDDPRSQRAEERTVILREGEGARGGMRGARAREKSSVTGSGRRKKALRTHMST